MQAGLVISSGATGGGGVSARHSGGGAAAQQGHFLSAQWCDGLYSLCSCDAPVILVLHVRSTTVLAVGNTQTYYYSTFAGCSVSGYSVMVSGRGGVLSDVQQELSCLSRTSSLQVPEQRLLAGSGFRFLPRGPPYDSVFCEAGGWERSAGKVEVMLRRCYRVNDLLLPWPSFSGSNRSQALPMSKGLALRLGAVVPLFLLYRRNCKYYIYK